MGPPIHYYGDMSMSDSKDKNNSPSKEDFEKMIEDIVSEVFKDWDSEENSEKEEEE